MKCINYEWRTSSGSMPVRGLACADLRCASWAFTAGATWSQQGCFFQEISEEAGCPERPVSMARPDNHRSLDCRHSSSITRT